MKDLIIRCTLMCDKETLKEEYKRINEQIGSGLIVLPWYDEVILNETNDEIKFAAIDQIKEKEKPKELIQRTDCIWYDEGYCELHECGECEMNDEMEGDDLK